MSVTRRWFIVAVLAACCAGPAMRVSAEGVTGMPADIPADAAADGPDGADAQAKAPSRVLIVMDERPAMEILAAYLKEKGGIDSTIVDQTSAPADWSGFAAVIGYVHGALQEPIELKIIDYTKRGGRYVCLHHSISSGKAKNKYYFDFLGVRLPGAEQSREPAQPGGHYAWRDPSHRRSSI